MDMKTLHNLLEPFPECFHKMIFHYIARDFHSEDPWLLLSEKGVDEP